MRILYRVRQFWQALTAVPNPEDVETARGLLTPSLMTLFLGMQPSEQAHSLRILQQLRQQGESDPDLLAAALLHDLGKSCHPLSIWERTLIVLGKAFFSRQAGQWGKGEPRGWRRAFVVAAQHPAWGAEMAVQAGASPLTAALIRRHQEFTSAQQMPEHGQKKVFFEEMALEETALEDRLLYRLQLLDNES